MANRVCGDDCPRLPRFELGSLDKMRKLYLFALFLALFVGFAGCKPDEAEAQCPLGGCCFAGRAAFRAPTAYPFPRFAPTRIAGVCEATCPPCGAVAETATPPPCGAVLTTEPTCGCGCGCGACRCGGGAVRVYTGRPIYTAAPRVGGGFGISVRIGGCRGGCCGF